MASTFKEGFERLIVLEEGGHVTSDSYGTLEGVWTVCVCVRDRKEAEPLAM